MKIKICGITNTEDAGVAVAAGADALGFVMYRKSPRWVEPTVAKSISRSSAFCASGGGVRQRRAREGSRTHG
jgi:phosphoribosylanthranilate isomerase